MAEENKAESTAPEKANPEKANPDSPTKGKDGENIIEGAKTGDTVAETAKPDSEAKDLKKADDKKAGEPAAKVKSDEASADSKSAEKKSAEKKPAEKKPAAKKPAAKKKEKPPKLEDKPFNEFMEQHYLPGLKAAMAKEGIDDLTLEFAKRKIEAMGLSDADPYWQVQGQWEEEGEGQRQFNIAFIEENIKGQKVFTLTANGAKPSTIEQFMGDERRITLDLMVGYTVQRLNGQKWLTRN